MSYRNEAGLYGGSGGTDIPARQSRPCNKCSATGDSAAPLSADQKHLLDWIESQCGVTQIWLDRLVANGDPQDLVSLIHRQAAWLDLIRSRLGSPS
ncbi:MAG: hypothetical protein WA989_04195 [Henriciella sp.]|uniref:hypothetical protein n=1 Tax=Henriciella sp. TaxID=1968823 RepID=UPI003C776C88